MNTNVVFLSPRAIKADYIAPILNTLNVARVISFLSMDNMPQSLTEEIVKRPFSVYDDSLSSFSMDEAIDSVSTQIIDNVLDGELRVCTHPRHGHFANECILVLADWQRSSIWTPDYSIKQYYNCLSKRGKEYLWWTDIYNCYPYHSSYGDLTSLVVGRIHSLLAQREQDELWNHISIVKVSVFFTSRKGGFTLAYDSKERRWREPVFYQSNHPEKPISYIHMLSMLNARKDETRFVFTNAEGHRMLYRLITDDAFFNLKFWVNQKQEQLRIDRERELFGDCDDDSNMEERGCGNGWTCDNCPNAGCPANELN